MKTEYSRLVRFLSVLWIIIFATEPRASAQSRPVLGLQFVDGQPTLTLTGVVGSVYLIQSAASLSSNNVWVNRTLIQAQGASTPWTDPFATAPAQRFYRTVSIAPPADTNLVFIQPGTFTMGSPANEAERFSNESQHVVNISGFWMKKYLVTQGDYVAVMGSNPSYFTAANSYSDDPTLPVEQVSWSDATNYCRLLTQQELGAGRIPTNCAYRLPTESEWEYADRAGTTTAFYLGSTLQSGQANFDGRYEYDAATGTVSNPTGVSLGMTTPVGSYDASPWGLYDMIGNVWEWTQDWYGQYPPGTVSDPQGPVSGSFRVLRGGNWNNSATYGRSAYRNVASPAFKYQNIGFRVVLALTPP
jgi:formylglycine-generating enzyme required for sulfatase activity